MAKSRIQGITVEINGDTTKLSKALEGVNKNIRNTQTQLKDVEKLLKLDPTNTELLAQKQKLLASEVSSAKDKLEMLKKASEEAAKTKDNYDAWKAKYDPIKQKITETEDKLKSLKEQSKIADEQLSKGEISQEKYDSIQNEIKSTSDELKNLRQSAKDVSDEFGNPISSEQFDSLQREIVDTQQELQRLQNEADKSRTALVKIGEAGETLQNVGGKISNAGEKLLPLTAGITAIGTGAVKTTADFDSEMSKVATVSGATGKDFDDLRAKAREMGAKTKFSATEAAEAMYYMAMAGWKTEAMLNGIDGVMNLAAASGEDLGTTSDIVTDALTALGYGAEDAGHFADVLAAASTNANTNVSLMGESFKYVAPVAGSMGASSEDLAIALGVMANAGVKGTQAGNSLKNALVNLVKPTDEQIEAMSQLGLVSSETITSIDSEKLAKAQTKVENKTIDLEKAQISYNDALTKYGEESSQAQKKYLDLQKAENNLAEAQRELTNEQEGTIKTVVTGQSAFVDEYGKMKSLKDIMDILRSSFKKVNVDLVDSEGNLRDYEDIIAEIEKSGNLKQAEQLQNASTVFGKRNLSGILAIINANEDDYERVTKAIKNCDGVAQDMAETMQDNLLGQITILMSQLGELAICFSDILMPAIREITAKIQAFIDKLNAMSPEAKETILKIALISAAIPPLLIIIGKVISVIGSLMKTIPTIPAMITKLKNGLTVIKTAISGISAPVVAIIAVIALLVGAFVHLWTTNEEFRNNIIAIWEQIKTTFSGFIQGIVDRLNALGFNFQDISEIIHTAWEGLCSVLAPIFEGAFQLISDIFKVVTDTLLGLLDVFIGFFTGNWSQVWNGIKEIFTGIWDFIKNFFGGILDTLKGIADVFLGLFDTSWNEVWTSVKNFFSDIWNSISAFFSVILNTIWGVVSTTWENIKTTISTVLDGIKFIISSIWNGIKNTVSNIMTTIKTVITVIWNSVKSAISSTIIGIKNTIVNGFNIAVDFVKNLAKDAWNWGADIIHGIVDGIKSKINDVAEAVTGVADKIRSFLHFSVPDEGPLTDFENWMPDFMQGLADGINANASLVNNALSSFGMNITVSLTDTFKNAMSNIVSIVNTFLQNTLMNITSICNDIKSNLNKVISDIVLNTKNNCVNILNIIETSIGNIKKSVNIGWDSVKNFIFTGQNEIKGTVSSTWNNISEGVRNTVNAIKNSVSSAWYAMPESVKVSMNNIRHTVFSIWDNIKEGLSYKIDDICNTIADAMETVSGIIQAKVNSAWSWGYDLVQNLINGIKYTVSDLVDTVAEVARTIWEYLHFSVPERGPLTDFESWMPDFMKGLAEGINKSKQYVEKAVESVADAMQISLNSDISANLNSLSGAMINENTAGTVNNYYQNDNSRTVNQTNNSPKSLSRLEIYRQTRNALKI